MFGSCQAAQTEGMLLKNYIQNIFTNLISFQVEWQSEQERKESKSIYHSEKEDSYIPVIPKAIEGSRVEGKTDVKDKSKINVNKVLSTSDDKTKKDDKNMGKQTSQGIKNSKQIFTRVRLHL